MTDYAKRLDEWEAKNADLWCEDIDHEPLLEIARELLKERDMLEQEVYNSHSRVLSSRRMIVVCDCNICAHVVPMVNRTPSASGEAITMKLLDELPAMLSRQLKTEG